MKTCIATSLRCLVLAKEEFSMSATEPIAEVTAREATEPCDGLPQQQAADGRESPFSVAELESFGADDADAGVNILRILTGAFAYTVFAGAVTSYWVFADRIAINSIVSVPSIVVIAIVVGLGWGRAMMGNNDSTH